MCEDDDLIQIRLRRYERREAQRKKQKTTLFKIGHFLGIPDFEYKERNI